MYIVQFVLVQTTTLTCGRHRSSSDNTCIAFWKTSSTSFFSSAEKDAHGSNLVKPAEIRSCTMRPAYMVNGYKVFSVTWSIFGYPQSPSDVTRLNGQPAYMVYFSWTKPRTITGLFIRSWPHGRTFVGFKL